MCRNCDLVLVILYLRSGTLCPAFRPRGSSDHESTVAAESISVTVIRVRKEFAMLNDYDRKRHFEDTPEPKGSRPKARSHRRKPLEFVVQKHSASRLHFDFRLELDGVLVSWAVPKGPSLNPGDKRLAVHVEDHPWEYRKFEGIIPAKQYGAGEVIVWDKGTYEPVDGSNEDVETQQKIVRDGLKSGKLSIELHGEKLKGVFALVETKGRGKNNWLLIKKDDDFADPEANVAVDSKSVLSDFTLDELQIESGKKKVSTAKTHSTKTSSKKSSKKEKVKEKEEKGTKSKISSARESLNRKKRPSRHEKMPARVEPMLTKTAEEPFSKDGWIYEPKLDGIRSIAYINESEVRLISRRGINVTERYPLIEKSLEENEDDIILDGEITAIDSQGRPSFQLLQRAGQTSDKEGLRIVFYVFDILYADGRNLVDHPLSSRRRILRQKLKQSDVVKIVNGLGSDGLKAFQACVDIDLEGIVAKKLDSVYKPGTRTADWLKVKSFKSSELLICGYSEGAGSRSDQFGALLLGYFDDHGELTYAGSVGTGFNSKIMRELLGIMKPLERKTSPFGLKTGKKRDVTWLTPKLVAEIKFSEWTADGLLRIPVFLRLREDIEPSTVVRR